MSSTYGTMDGAYFVGRNELLGWLNDLLAINYTKVEQCANGNNLGGVIIVVDVEAGAAYVQIMDSIYPGEVPLKKVNFNAHLEHDFWKNYKVLQTFFEKKKIGKVVEVSKLCRAKQMDNLEMLQWCKRYWDIHYGGQPYNATERRNQVYGTKENAPVAAPVTGRNAGGKKSVPVPAPGRTNRESGQNQEEYGTDGTADERVTLLTEEVAAMHIQLSELEKERDFYFSKLREIEIHITCEDLPKHVPECSALSETIKGILYSSTGDDGTEMEVVDTEAEVVTSTVVEA